jgi:hypothetical protein
MPAVRNGASQLQIRGERKGCRPNTIPSSVKNEQKTRVYAEAHMRRGSKAPAAPTSE